MANSSSTTVWEIADIIYQFTPVAQSCPILCDPMDCSTPDLPVYHQLPEFTQTHVHWVGESALCIRWPKYWSFSFNIRPSINTQGWSPLGWTGWISLQSKGLSRVFSNTTVQTHQFFNAQLFFIVQLSHPYMTTVKTIDLTRQTFVGKLMSLLFNMLFWWVITFLLRSKHLLISWLNSTSAVILEAPPPQIKFITVSTVSPFICFEVMDQMPWS